jgi:cytidylate kinase
MPEVIPGTAIALYNVNSLIFAPFWARQAHFSSPERKGETTMLPRYSAEQLIEAVEKASEHWRTKRQPGEGEPGGVIAPTAFTIAISREAGALGSTVAQKIGARLNWPVYNKELLEHISKETGWKVKLLESVDEKHINWLQECVEQFTLVPRVSENAYVKYLVKALFTLASYGNCIIVGRGAAQILPKTSTLRVYLMGPEKDRIDYIRKKFALSEQDATKWVRQTDKERVTFIRDHFQKISTEVHYYDLVLNTTRLSADTAADIICTALKEMQKKNA